MEIERFGEPHGAPCIAFAGAPCIMCGMWCTMKLLLTWFDRIGANPTAADTGPVLRLLAHRAGYDAAVVLCTRSERGGARALAKHMRRHVEAVEVHPVAVDDPSDYGQVFKAVSGLLEVLPEASSVDVLLSTGTPQAQTIWVVLVESGLLDAQMLQVIPARFVPVPHAHPVREVQLDIEGFPQIRALQAEVARLRARTHAIAPGLIGDSPAMQILAGRLFKVARSKIAVLLQGESGTGKELVARAIHDASDRAEGPFIAFNCGTLSDQLAQSELFGHERGAFTGAERAHGGYFEQASGGTLFFDEVAELSARAQVQLLRALQEQRIRRVGAQGEIAIDTRVIAGSHADLRARVRQGTFRQDLYYRLQGATLQVPALRERLGDIGQLVNHFMDRFGERRPLSQDAWRALHGADWPGNVRELRSCIERALVFADAVIEVEDLGLDPDLARPAPAAPALKPLEVGAQQTLKEAVEQAERTTIAASFSAHAGNISQTARALGIDRNTLKRKLVQYGVR